MTWIKFPNQINDLKKLRHALQVAAPMTATDLKDDGVYGDELLRAGVISTNKSSTDLHNLPSSRQPHRTSARGLRELFVLLGCMEPSTNGVKMTPDGRAIARQSSQVMSPFERQLWIKVISKLSFPHPSYPQLSVGVTNVRPLHVVLAMLAPNPLPSQGLAFAFGARNESPAEISAVRAMASRWTGANAGQLATQIGTTESELRNNSKVFPGILEQLGLIERRGGIAQILPAGLALLGAGGQPTPGQLRNQARRRQHRGRPITNSSNTPWVPTPIDPNDLAERALLQLLRTERANQDHQRALTKANQWLKSKRFRTSEADYDMLAKRRGLWLLIEIKSVGTASVRIQTIRAIGQLAYYFALSIPRPPRNTKLVRAVVYDRPPEDQVAISVLRGEGIQAAWMEGTDLKFNDAVFAAEVETP